MIIQTILLELALIVTIYSLLSLILFFHPKIEETQYSFVPAYVASILWVIFYYLTHI